MAELQVMNSLVIDTATIRTTCAVFRGNELIFDSHHDGATEHAEALPKLVHEALRIESNINQVVVGMGPGPFTGLRVGIVFAQLFAAAREIPCIGTCSLDAIDIDSEEYIVATDARRKEIYWARYKSGIRVAGPSVAAPNMLIDISVPKFGFTFTEPLFPSPHLLLARSFSAPVNEPMYLRRPDALPTSERP